MEHMQTSTPVTQQDSFPAGIDVVDSFLPPAVFQEILKKTNLHDSVFGTLEQPRAKCKEEGEMHVNLPAARHAIRNLIADPTENHSELQTQDSDNDDQLTIRLHWGNHVDHVDYYRGTSDTKYGLSHIVGLVYLGGSGTLIFTELGGSRREHHVRVCSNRAVRFDNSKFSHRVETTDTTAPRVILGPYTLGREGGLHEAGDAANAAGIAGTIISQIIFLICAITCFLGFLGTLIGALYLFSTWESAQGQAALVGVTNTSTTKSVVDFNPGLFIASGVCFALSVTFLALCLWCKKLSPKK